MPLAAFLNSSASFTNIGNHIRPLYMLLHEKNSSYSLRYIVLPSFLLAACSIRSIIVRSSNNFLTRGAGPPGIFAMLSACSKNPLLLLIEVNIKFQYIHKRQIFHFCLIRNIIHIYKLDKPYNRIRMGSAKNHIVLN